jgi:creatinine amidohydrolase
MRFEELRSPEVDRLDRERTVLLLPIGSMEQHGKHMPLGTDTMLANGVCEAAARQLAPNVMVLPPLWYGFSPHHMRFAGSVTLGPETLMRLISDIVGSLVRHGFRRLVLVNGHGGNADLLGAAVAALGHEHHGMARIAGLTYFRLAAHEIASLRKSRKGGMGHAGEFETAMMMRVRPSLVHIEAANATYPETGTTYLSTDLLEASRVSAYLDIADLSPSGTLGDPTLASPEAGERFFDACAQALATFLQDFAHWPIEVGGRP